MSAVLIPLQAVPSQTLSVNLAGQSAQLVLYQRRYGFFVDLYLNNTLVRRGMEALNLVRIVRDEYLGFTGNLFFYDTAGDDAPQYSGLGSRWVLLYDASLP